MQSTLSNINYKFKIQDFAKDILILTTVRFVSRRLNVFLLNTEYTSNIAGYVTYCFEYYVLFLLYSKGILFNSTGLLSV